MSSQVNNVFDQLFQITKQLSDEKAPSAIHKILKELYQIIQKHVTKYESINMLPVHAQTTFISISHLLTSIIANPDFPADSILLSSTCIAVLVAEIFSPDFASKFLIFLYHSVGKKIQGATLDGFIENETHPKSLYISFETCQIKEFLTTSSEEQTDLISIVQEFIQEEDKRKIPTFHQIAILHGILSCQRTDLFPFKSRLFGHKPFLIAIFNSIYLSCLTPCSSQYHAFSTLVNWLKTCQKFFHKLFDNRDNKSEIYFSSDTFIVKKILYLLESNWESPIKGVSSFVKEAYRLLIALSKTECYYLKNYDFDIVYYLLDQTSKLSWKVKGKYIVLSIILQFIDYTKFVKKHPDVPKEIILNLKANYAASAISEVYKSIVESMKKENSSLSDLHKEWCFWWKEPIVASLVSNDKLLIQGVANLILPWTLNSIPNSYELLLDVFEKEGDTAPTLMLMRIAKESGICELREKEVNLIRKYLHHQNVHLRMEILSVLCSSSKKSEALSEDELKLLQDFIIANLNIDSTSFQQLLLSQLRVLLVRIRNSLVQEYRLKCKDAHLIPEHLLKAKNVHLQLNQAQLEFVEWLVETAVLNTFPGASFQRRRISLSILNIIFDVLVVSPQGNKRKEKPSKFVKQVIQVAQMKDLWKFLIDETLLNIFPCVTDYTDEVRALAYSLLVEFSTWPGIYKDLPCETLIRRGFDLCSNPDYRSNEAGAYLICLVYKKFYVRDNKFAESNGAFIIPYLSRIFGRTGYQEYYILIDVPTVKYTHGVLLALQYCLSNSKEALRSYSYKQPAKVVQFVDSVMNFCEITIEEVLNVLRGDDEKNHCPSFSDIGEALEKVVISQQSEIEKAVDLSKEVELLLTCCWHKIKNCCFVLYELASCIYELNIDIQSKKGYLCKISDQLSYVLITCRHRGIVDACSLALNKFCVMLLKDDDLHEEICKSLLNSAFDSLSDATATSVTRRSAGLPSLIQAVVSSESNNIQRKLLSFTIQKLLVCFDQPLHPNHDISDKTDLPQAHVYHILRALVTEASLSQAILSHLDSIIPACISGFSSSLWPIRNGALQLFGVLLPRICGQKKVRDEDSEHNQISASELFARCPNLKVFLHHKLKECVEFHHKKKLSSVLVPVLSILVKLSPPQENNEIFVTEFKMLLVDLLDIPIWKVRDLVSSALSTLVTVDDIREKLEELNQDLHSHNINCNKIHGILLLMQKVSKRNKFCSEACNLIKSLANLYELLLERNCQLLVGVLLDTILIITRSNGISVFNEIHKSLCSLESNYNNMVGSEYHESRIIALKLRTSERSEIPSIIKEQSQKDGSIVNECLQFLTEMLHSERIKLEFHDEKNLKFWKEICLALLSFIEKERHPSIIQDSLKFYIDLCYDWKIGAYILNPSICKSLEEKLEHHLDMKTGLSTSAYSLTLLSLCLKSNLHQVRDSDYLEKWTMLFSSYSQPRSSDILRLQAAYSISCVGPSLVEYLSKRISSKCEKSVFLYLNLLLLQDEDEEIRNKACEFPSNIHHKYEINSLQFNIGIQVILQHMFHLLHDNNFFVLYLWNRLQNFPSTSRVVMSVNNSISNATSGSLFEQELVNVYAEPISLLLQYRNLLKMTLEELHKRNPSFWKDTVEIFSLDLLPEIRDLLHVLKNCKTINLCGLTYPHHGLLALKKLQCQVQVLLPQKIRLNLHVHLHQRLETITNRWREVETFLRCTVSWYFLKL
ncbi:unnamed protein product [Larinioides sclopetarius]|uniref:DUF2428 domain-containing protein n=1 Tax=Larinioides sclopetarius TaxID=280406 RepID=A0AAV1YZJ5_9ARAC